MISYSINEDAVSNGDDILDMISNIPLNSLNPIGNGILFIISDN